MNDPNIPRMDLHDRRWESLHRNWGWLLALGIALLVLGIIAISVSVLTTFVAIVTIGWLLMIAGGVMMIHAIWSHRWNRFFPTFLIGLLYAALGVWMAARPLQSALSLTLLLAAFFTVAGLFRIITVLSFRQAHWGWVLFNGLISLLLGLMIWAQWPVSGLWVIGTFVGIDMIIAGWSYIMLATVSRHPPALAA